MFRDANVGKHLKVVFILLSTPEHVCNGAMKELPVHFLTNSCFFDFSKWNIWNLAELQLGHTFMEVGEVGVVIHSSGTFLKNSFSFNVGFEGRNFHYN